MQGRINKIIKEQREKGKKAFGIKARPVDTLLSIHGMKFLKRN